MVVALEEKGGGGGGEGVGAHYVPLPYFLAISPVIYTNILRWVRGFHYKPLYLVVFTSYPSVSWELKDKRNLRNLQF